MERLLATVNANHAKSDADRKADKEEMLAAIKANQETTTRMEANVDSIKAALKRAIREIKFSRGEATARQETMEARLEVEEPASVDMTPEVADDHEVPREDAEVMAVGGPKERCRDRHLAAVRRQKKQNRDLDARRLRKKQGRAQRKNGCLKNLVTAHRGTTCRAVVAR
jgi:hypothetical protein